MRSFELISQSIQALDGGTFQQFAARYVAYRYQVDECYNTGIKAGTLKPTKGTPDSLFYSIRLGGFIFVECGSYTGRSQAIRKIKGDIQKCLDEEKGSLPNGRLKAIVCCYSERSLSVEDISDIKRIDERVELIGLDTIAEACDRYCPWLAEEYLNLPCQNAVVDLQAFVSHHEGRPFSPTLQTKLEDREGELADLVSLIGNNQAVILSGFPGIGKTRLAIEACKAWAMENAADILAIKTWEQGAVESLRRCLRPGIPCLLLVDDANELMELKALAHFLVDNEDCRIVLTVRSYVREDIIDCFVGICGIGRMNLKALSTDSVSKILKESYPQCSDQKLHIISIVSRCNVRLAMMACEQLGSSDPHSLTDLLEICYGRRLEFLSACERSAIEIASVLGPHMPDECSNLPALEDLFSITHADYCSACRLLCKKELMDALPGLSCVKFEDQNLRDYFLHHAFIDERCMQLKNLWGLHDGEHLTIRIANNLLQVYRDNETFEGLSLQVQPIWESAKPESKLHIVVALNALIGVKGLDYLQSHIDSMAVGERVDYLASDNDRLSCLSSDVPVEIAALSAFAPSNPDDVIDLAFSLLAKANGPSWAFKKLFAQDLCMTETSLHRGFSNEKRLMARLQDSYRETNDPTYAVLLIRVVEAVLSDQRDAVGYIDERQVSLARMSFPFSESLLEARRQGIDALLDMLDHGLISDRAVEVLASYVPMPGGVGDRDLGRATLELVLKRFVPRCPLKSISDFRRLGHLRLQCARLDVCSEEIEVAFNRTSTSRFAAVLSERDYESQQDWIDRLFAAGSLMAEADWAGLVEIVARSSNEDASLAEGCLAIYFQNSDALDIRDALFDRFAHEGLFVGRRYLDWVYRTYGPASGRAYLLGNVPAGSIMRFLVSFDQYVILDQDDTSQYETYLEAIGSLGEVIPFDCVLEISEKHPEFFSNYVCELMKKFGDEPRQLLAFLPYDFSKYVSRQFLGRTEPINALELLVGALGFNQKLAHPHGLIPYLLDGNPSLFVELLLKTIVDDAFGFVEEGAASELIWKLQNPLAVFDQVVDACADLRLYERGGKKSRSAIKRIILTADAEMQDILLDDVVRQAAQHDDSSFFSDVLSALPFALRMKCAALLYQEDASVEVFERAVLQMSFEGETFIGSELPSIDRKINDLEELNAILLSKGISEYSRRTRRYIECLKQYCCTVKTEEFAR